MKLKIIILLFLTGSTLGCTHSAQFKGFAYFVIDTIGSNLGQTDLADMDNDGDLDWIAGEAPWSKTSRLWWWEYKAPGNWVRHYIGQADSDVGGDCFDINSDGRTDFWGGRVLYLSNKDTTYVAYSPGTIFSHDSRFGEINGDGRTDALANWDQYGLVWYEIPGNPGKPWAERMIMPSSEHKIHGGVSPQPFGDIDSDGDTDIVTGQAWYENRDGIGLTWVQHKNIDFGEEHQYGIALKTWVTDMDNDGDADVVQAEADNPDSRIAWFENDGKGNWTNHIIKSKGDGQDFHSLIVADFDNDGDQDIFSGGGPLSSGKHKCYIWENRAGRNGKPTSDKWEEHIVAEMPCHEAAGGDVDGDGDIDICSKPWTTGNVHFYLQNLLK